MKEAFELPPLLHLEQERRAEKQPRASSSSSSGSSRKGLKHAFICLQRANSVVITMRHVILCNSP